jgi:ABC-type phosphate/phosphonate transport system substrate-binding protein
VTRPVAVLPMYDWPEITAATDRLWDAIRDGIRAAGIDAPRKLSRSGDPTRLWTDPDLLLGQTCGLPYVRFLRGRVAPLGSPDYGVPGCAPGWYRSALIVRADDGRDTLADFRGARFAANARESQSGWAAMAHHVAALGAEQAFFGRVKLTGAHAASASSVAAGRADIAAIDFVTWRLIRRYRPEAAGLRVLMLTDPTAGLPYVTALSDRTDSLREAVETAILGLDAAVADTLGIRGFARIGEADYDLIRDRADAARGRGM